MPTVLAMGGCDRPTVCAALELACGIAVRQRSPILVVGVASRRISWELLAPMTGYITASEVQRMALERVQRLIRECVADLPEHVPVTHASCARWGNASFTRLVPAEGDRILIVAHAAPSILARRAARRLASAIGAQLVLVSAGGHEQEPGVALAPNTASA